MFMSIFAKKNKTGGIADVIRCDQEDYLIWKWHPKGAAEGDLKRDTAIRTNSVLRVKDGEVAVFVYKQKDGHNQDFIVGPHDETLKTKNFPVLSSIIGLWYEKDTPFQAEVFFINLGRALQVKFGVPYFDIADPRFPDFEAPVAVRGTLTFKIEDYEAFVKHYQLATFEMEDFKKKVTDAIARYVKDSVAKAPAENDIPLIQIESKIDLINDKAELNVKERLYETFGVTVTGFDISAIEIDKESEGYQELRNISKGMAGRKAEIDIQHYEESLRIQREEGQYAAHMGTKQANLGAYETEVKGEVGVESAKALGKMGENGAGRIDIGGDGGQGGGAGFNPVSLMAGLAVGGAVVKNIGGTLDQTMNSSGNVPPAIPTVTFHVAIDGKAVGPFETAKVIEMINSGQVLKDTLIWKQGTPNWVKAGELKEFSDLFPPDLPPAK